ncbi:MAG: DUF2075 domain-containing protein [Candidatus Saccharibacteria bacterium]|nr:DUF2075 domain-containing protein [Candidatus Saccharibacteria bacterium]
MLVYEGVKKTFIDDVNLNLIVNKIYEKYQKYFGRTSESQLNSWQNSMQYMRSILDDDEIPDNAGVAIEFNIPTTSKRIDFILSGRDHDMKDSAVIVELKQWESCSAIENKDGIVSTYVGGGIRDVAHPSYQAMSYANLIRDFNEDVRHKNIGLYPCAFLHNYRITEDSPINNPIYKEYIEQAPMFGSGDFAKLREFIKKYIFYGDDKEILYEIENGRIRPSKRLQDSLVNMLQGNREFTMIDEQKVIYEDAIVLAKNAVKNNSKQVLIVEGGPGTGKSVLAINLLVELTKNNFTCFYVTKNSAPRNVFRDKLKGNFKQSYIDNLFQGSGSFVNKPSNDIDCLVVDEAHRLNEKSGLFSNLGENQVKEIINASRFSVFFIDEDQRVTMKDVGSIDMINEFATQLGAQVKKVELESQFRCNGSDGYLAWLDNMLEIRQTANFDMMDFDYDFRVFDNPNEMREAIKQKNLENNKSRIVAGYCWNWISEGKNSDEIKDIVIPEYNFAMSWNLGNTNTWAIDPNSVNQAGCIHTCQGLEFDYVGVIIGDDLRYENDHIVTDFTKRAKTDKSLFGIQKMYNNEPYEALDISGRIIKNTYRTLMTRGMKGCYIYCTDKQLSKHLKEIISRAE